ncbi:unnamed protein product, partial [Prunus brigantina]
MIETQSGRKIKTLRSDNGGEYKSDPFLKVCQDEGIVRHFTVRETPQQNGVAERMNRTLLEKVRCMLSNAGLGKAFWAEAITYASHLINRLPAAANEGKTPMEVCTGVKGYRLWCPDEKKIVVSRDVTFDEAAMPARFTDIVAYALPVIEDDIPSAYKEAVRSSESVEWKKSMDEEMKSLHKNETWELVQLPNGKKAIGCKWVYAKKTESLGKDNVRFKARLVAKGYAQKEGIDYNEVFSPVVKHSSIRILLALVAQFDLELAQLDVKTAFLHGDLEEEIYMSQPEGFKVAGKENWVCKLQKSLYGLKQSPRQWYKRFDRFMIGQKYTRSHYDHCVYFRKLQDGTFIYLLLYVDDMLIACKSKVEIERLKTQLSNEFEMKDLGEARKILGMEIERDRAKGKISLCQKQYLKKDKVTGQCVVGYVDSDYAGDLDKRRSTTGFVFSIAGGPVSWRSILQSTVALSTTEAEYMAVTEAIKEAIWLQGLLDDLGVQQDHVDVHCDSQSAIYLAKNQVHHAR